MRRERTKKKRKRKRRIRIRTNKKGRIRQNFEKRVKMKIQGIRIAWAVKKSLRGRRKKIQT